MLSEEKIRELLDKCVERRASLGGCATVDVNAPVALIQNALEAQIGLLELILETKVEKPWNSLKKNT